MMKIQSAAVTLVALILACARPHGATVSPEKALNELLAADRAFAAASSGVDLITGVTRMFASDIVMLSAGRVAHGVDSAAALLRVNPINATARMSWKPIAAQLSRSGDVGYTYGYFRVDVQNGNAVAGKYLAFWTRTTSGWRVSAYKRTVGPRSDTVTVTAVQTGLPEYRGGGDSTRRAAELHVAEARFSDLAQTVSLGEAFRRTATPDAVHTATGTDVTFRFGPDAIKAGLDRGGSSRPPLTWRSDEERVARNGDMGLTTGWITIGRTPGGELARVPYFTIWKAAADGTWRFAAE